MLKDGVRLVCQGRGGGRRGDIGDNGDDVIDNDSDGGDKECNITDMLDEVLLFDEEDSDNESDDDEMLWGEI